MAQIGLENVQVHSIEQAIMPQKEGNYLSETLKAIVLKANIQIKRPKHNLNYLLNTLFYKQAKLENLTASRKHPTSRKKFSLWQKLIPYLGISD
jgi:sugar diacid utilization regulator